MRALFLVLLLANILFFAWTRWLAPPADTGGRPTPTSQGPHTIRLLREAAPAGHAYDSSRAGTTTRPGASASCVSGGPYLDRAAADRAAARLAKLGFTSRLRSSRDEIRVGQWVRIENLATAADAQNAIATLRAAGIRDAYLLGDEWPGNVVSLGVFADETRAAEVEGIARRAGFTPTVSERARTEDVFWLDVDRDSNAGLPGAEVFGTADRPEPRLELRACPDSQTVTPGGPAP